MKTSKMALMFTLAFAAMVLSSNSLRADFWSDLRDSVIVKNELTATPDVEKVVFRNLTTEIIYLATASNHGIVDGWKTIEGGREIEVTFRAGQFYFAANDSKGNQYGFSAPTTILPTTNRRFELRFNQDQSCTAIVDGNNRGTYRRQYLHELGFSDRRFFQYPTNVKAIVFDKPAGNPQQSMKPQIQPPTVQHNVVIEPPFSARKPRFRVTQNGTDTLFVLQPNGVCEAWEDGKKLVMQTVSNTNGVVTLRYSEKNTAFQIRGQSLYVLTAGSANWRYLVDGQWRND